MRAIVDVSTIELIRSFFLSIISGLIICCSAQCQDSIHFYGDTTTFSDVFDVTETCDRGYCIAGVKSEGANFFGWIQKTSINGDALWNKSYGSLGMQHGFVSLLKADDGGMVCAGSTSKVSPGCGDPMVLKLNACGEKEWCRIYPSSNCNASAMSIAAIPGGGFMMLVQDWTGAPDVWIFRLTETGGVIWTKEYVSDPFFSPARGHFLYSGHPIPVIWSPEKPIHPIHFTRATISGKSFS